MLKMVDGTGIIGVDMICPLGVSTPQPPNYDRVELEGAGMLVLPNSLDAPLERLELGGKTEQVQTTGVNLFDEKLLLDFDSENYDKTQSGSGFYYYKFPVSGTVTVSTKNANKNGEYLTVGIKPDGSDKTWLSHGSAAISKYKTLTPEDGNIYLGVNNNLERVKSMIQNTGGIMLNEGSKSISYEPYTGGKPSPSPEYPQEIKNVGKWNEEKQKYEVDVKVFAGNLFDGSNSKKGFFTGEFGGQISLITSQGYSWESKIDTLSGVKVTLSVQSNVNTRFRIYATDINGMILYKYEDSSANQADNYHTFVIPDKTENLLVSVLEISDSKDAKIILNVGENRLPNAIYKAPQSLTLTSDRPLTKWDRLVEQGGQIGWLYGSVIATIDETADISLYAPNGFFIHVKNIDKKEKTGYCDKLYTKKMSNGEPFVLFGIANNNFLYTLNTQEFYGKTASEIKAKLKEYPLNIIGKSETTEFIPLQQSEQNAIRALKTYYPTTVITADGGELDPDIKVTYRKEI